MKQLKDNDEIKNTSPYIGYVDLIGKGNVTLTIADVEDASGEKVDGVREAKLGTYAITFKEIKERKMVIQGRKKKFLMRQFGKMKSGWVGQSITIYSDPHVKFGGKEVGGIKIVGQDGE